jgi:hypothetical protein
MVKNLKDLPFSMAISIKEKSYNLIEQLHPELKSSNEYYINELKSNFKYLTTISKEIGAKCSGLIWVQYAEAA